MYTKKIIFICLVVSAIALSFFVWTRKNPYRIACEFVAEKIYLSDEQVLPWKMMCLERSRLVKPWTSSAVVISDLNKMLQMLRVSHLEIFRPSEVKNVWQGVQEETGLESEFVDGELVIFRVHPGSMAEKQGLRYGDIIISFNQETPSPWETSRSRGEIIYRRGTKTEKIQLTTSEVKKDEKPSFVKMNAKTWVLKIPSFRKDFFHEELSKTAPPEFMRAENIILDLRGNRGGNFIAGLRLMSAFLCHPQLIGILKKPKSPQTSELFLSNTLDELKQVEILEKPANVKLQTFEVEQCAKAKKIIVFVDAKTASVAEMVAQGLKELRGARIVGNQSAGQVLVGVWYPFEELGKGVEISIPEAIYTSAKGHVLEGMGVQLDKTLYYDLKDMQRGRDSWVEKIKTGL